MFDALLPGVRRVGGSDDARHVACEDKMPIARGARCGEVVLTRELAVHLHEVHAEANERVHCRSRLSGRSHEEVRDRHISAFEVWT